MRVAPVCALAAGLLPACADPPEIEVAYRCDPTLCGSKFRIGHRAAHDSTSAARMRAAGAIVLGKTNCPEFLMNYESDNFIIGSDYPHPPSTFPTTAAGIEAMQGLSEQDKANILGGNMMRVLGLS